MAIMPVVCGLESIWRYWRLPLLLPHFIHCSFACKMFLSVSQWRGEGSVVKCRGEWAKRTPLLATLRSMTKTATITYSIPNIILVIHHVRMRMRIEDRHTAAVVSNGACARANL